MYLLITAIPTVFENVLEQGEKAEQRQDQSPTPSTTLDDNDDIIISEEICPPNCSPPPPIQELPKE